MKKLFLSALALLLSSCVSVKGGNLPKLPGSNYYNLYGTPTGWAESTVDLENFKFAEDSPMKEETDCIYSGRWSSKYGDFKVNTKGSFINQKCLSWGVLTYERFSSTLKLNIISTKKSPECLPAGEYVCENRNLGIQCKNFFLFRLSTYEQSNK